MAITRGTLAQEVDGKVEYIYPKTDASIVEYSASQSVKDKLDELDKNIAEINDRITNIASAIQYSSTDIKSDVD